MCGRHPGRVERVGRMSGRGSPRPGWLAAIPSTPDGVEERRGRGRGGEDCRPSRRCRCERWRHQTEQKRGEELAKRSAASFALVLSSFPSACSFALPCPYHLKDGRGRGRGGQDGRPSRRCPSAGRSVPMWWRCGGDCIAQNWTSWPPVLSLSADTSGRSGERLAMVWTVKTQTKQKRGEELAKIAAASFALVLSLPSLLLAFVFSLYIIMYI